MKDWIGRVGLFGLVSAAIFGSSLAGCAGERDPINRVQQGVVDKAFFIGANFEDFRDDPEFRTKSFNIDSGANSDNYAGTVGGATAVDRIRWEVTENMLFARRSYQEAPGADNRGLPRKEVSPGKLEFPGKPTGTIIAAYKIVSHFDIRREYNPSTGEEQNTIVENSSDRPWFQRDHMRVDWSMNLAESSSGDTSWVFGAGSLATAIQYSPTNDNDEDRPHFENGYFDITSKYQLKSQELPGFGVSECVILGFFNGSSSFDCTPVEVKFRSSFVRLNGDEDYEPFEESRAQRDIVGNWGNAGNNFNREYGAAPITAWDPQYGYTDAKTKTFFAVHNIWTKMHIGPKRDAAAAGVVSRMQTGQRAVQRRVKPGKPGQHKRRRDVSDHRQQQHPQHQRPPPRRPNPGKRAQHEQLHQPGTRRRRRIASRQQPGGQHK